MYLDAPQRAIVLSVDEKTQVQAIDRTQKGLPVHPGLRFLLRLGGTRTHDFKRNGTTTLFATLNVAEGIVIDKCMKRHRHQEWIRFLKEIDARTPPALDLHLIADNYATHKHPAVLRWLSQASPAVPHALHPDLRRLADGRQPPTPSSTQSPAERLPSIRSLNSDAVH